MLLPALALEYITGQPAEYSMSTHKYYRAKNVVAGASEGGWVWVGGRGVRLCPAWGENVLICKAKGVEGFMMVLAASAESQWF
jgi:hypothetical protein